MAWWLNNNDGVWVSLALLWAGFCILMYFYNRLHHPYVRINDFDKKTCTVDLVISHKLNRLIIRLGSTSQVFYFEGVEYFWSAVDTDPNQVYTLCINNKGRSKEVFRIDFTNHKMHMEYVV